MKKLFLLPGILWMQSIVPLFGQTTDSCQMKLGMNLTWINNFNYEFPFVDVMKSCAVWMTQDTAGFLLSNTNQLSSISLNANGYPLQLPVNLSGQPRTVFTNMAGGTNGDYPAGQYTVIYDGTGTLKFAGDASFVSKSGNQILINVTPSNNGIYLKIVTSSAADPVRNIRVLMPGTILTYQTQPFNPTFLDKIAPFSNLRLMNWLFTNGNENIQWANRRSPTYYTQATYGASSPRLGCAYEYVIAIGNITQKDIWINVPHMADSNYIAEMAKLFRDSLNPGLKIYLEYSNEVWNTSFGQYNWVNTNGIGSNQSEKTAYFMKRVFDIWSNVFGSQTSTRLIKVAGCFLGQISVGTEIMNYLQNNNAMPDVLSPAAYFGLVPADYSVLQGLGSSATVNDVCNLMQSRMPSYIPQLIQHSNLAAQKSVRLSFYEGGQHLIIQGQPSDQAIYSAQINTCMHNLYAQWLDVLSDTTAADLFMQFHLAGSQTNANVGGGTFGALESIYDSTSQKYQALIDYMNDCQVVTSNEENNYMINFASIYPNPFSSKTTLQTDKALINASLTLYNSLGQAVKQIKSINGQEIILQRHNLPNGLYFILLTEDNNTIASDKIVIAN